MNVEYSAASELGTVDSEIIINLLVMNGAKWGTSV